MNQTVLTHPAEHFDTPFELLAAEGLTPTQKRRALKSWEFDEIQKLRATAENMGGVRRAPSLLRAVRKCLDRLPD